jgi:hypothetical protein
VKKLLFTVLCLLALPVYAQFTPGQILTAAELNSQFALYAPLTGATYTGPVVGTNFSGAFTGTTTTQGRLDNSTSLATDAFVNQQNASAVATVNFAGVSGGVYNQATLGSGCQVVVFASGGVITSSLTISNPGSGYQVGDLLAVPAGNSDAVLRVTGVSGGGVTSVGIANGGTGYVTGQVATAMAVPPGRRAVNFTGTLTSNLTFIIQNGAYLTASREIEFINNTTGGFTVTVYLSNGADGHTGNGVVLPQGSNNSTAVSLYTDGVNDVWLANSLAGIGVGTTYAPINSPTFTGTVTIPSGASISGYLTTATAASTYAPIASPTFTGTPAAPTASATTSTTQLATTAMVNSAVTSNALAGSFTSLNASGNDALFYQNSTGQSFTSGTAATVTGWTKVYDRLSTNFNASTGIFTAPATGYYQISAQLTWISAANVVATAVAAEISVNGTIEAIGLNYQTSTSTSPNSVQVSGVVALTSGQTLSLLGLQTSGTTRTLQGLGTSSYLSINRLP